MSRPTEADKQKAATLGNLGWAQRRDRIAQALADERVVALRYALRNFKTEYNAYLGESQGAWQAALDDAFRRVRDTLDGDAGLPDESMAALEERDELVAFLREHGEAITSALSASVDLTGMLDSAPALNAGLKLSTLLEKHDEME